MAEEFEGRDLSESTFWGVDLSRSTFRDVNFTGARMESVWVVDVEIEGLVDRLVVNGVDVTAYVNEHDPWMPLRGMLRPTDAAGMRETCDELERTWNTLIERAAHLSDAQRHESVGGEWSFAETLRHLVFGIDKWFTVPVLGEATFHPIGLPNTGSREFPWPGVDLAANPTYDEVLAARADRMARVRAYLDTVTPAELAREVDVLENGTTPVAECVLVVFEESFGHYRYAVRDLAILEAAAG